MRYVIAAVLALTVANPAAAQSRTIPKDAEPGVIRHLQAMIVEIDGKPRGLSPGAQIRDADNRLVLPASLVEKSMARYLLDRDGMVHRVWILTPKEEAALPPPPYPK